MGCAIFCGQSNNNPEQKEGYQFVSLNGKGHGKEALFGN